MTHDGRGRECGSGHDGIVTSAYPLRSMDMAFFCNQRV